MALTKRSFSGEEQRQHSWDRGGPFEAGEDPDQAIITLTGAAAMQSKASKGLQGGQAGPGGMSAPPRSGYSATAGADAMPAAGNSASTGRAGASPRTAGDTNPDGTGAGRGSKTVRRHGGVIGATPALTGGEGGALGRNTAR